MNAVHEPSQPARRIACLRCRTRKKKCDRDYPICSQCRDAGETCYMLRPRHSRALRQNDPALIRHDIASLQKRLLQIEAHACPTSPLTGGTAPPTLSQELDGLANCHFQQADVPPLPAADSMQQISAFETDSCRPASQSDGSVVSLPNAAMTSLYDISNKSSPSAAVALDSSCGTSRGLQVPVWLFHDLACLPDDQDVNDGVPTPSELPRDTQQHEPSSGTLGASERVYLDLYFQLVQPQWPLFVRSQCDEWFSHLVAYGSSGYEYQESIVKIICATGALFCSSFKPECRHLAASNWLYQQTVLKGNLQTTPRSLARLAILLVQTIYLLHHPESDPVDGTPTTKAQACRDVLKQVGWRLRAVSNTHATALHFEDKDNFAPGTVEMILMTCFTVNEVVYSSWSINRSSDDEALDETLWNQCSPMITRCPSQSGGAVDHIFQVRRLQYEIRRFLRQTAHLPHDDPDRMGWRDTLNKELNQWKAMISSVASDDDESFNYRSQTMRKMYDYCLCLLFESELLTMNASCLEALLRAAGEACISFRRIQNHGAMIYFTCSALSTQFRMGLIILACFWLTKGHERSIAYLGSETFAAIEACFDTLSKFARRWSDTSVYRDTFELIASATPFAHLTPTRSHVFPRQHAHLLVQYRDQLTRRNCPKIVTSIITYVLDRSE